MINLSEYYTHVYQRRRPFVSTTARARVSLPPCLRVRVVREIVSVLQNELNTFLTYSFGIKHSHSTSALKGESVAVRCEKNVDVAAHSQ